MDLLLVLGGWWVVGGLYWLLCLATTLWFVSQYEPGKPFEEEVSDESEPYQPPEPFMRLDRPPGVYEILKTSFVLMLVPFRLVAIFSVLIGVWAALRIVLLGVEDLEAPISGWKRGVVTFLTKYGARAELWFMGFWITEKRDPRAQMDDDTAAVIVSNHVSWLDILVCVATFGNSFIAKEATKNVPFVGFLSRAVQTCYVSSAKRSGAANGAAVKKGPSTTEKIMARQKEPEKWNKLLVFPEGTTTNGDMMVKFRSGAFVAGAPVQPIALRYRCRNFHLAYDCIYGSYHIFRTLTQLVNFVDITVLPIYKPDEEEKADPKRFAGSVGSMIAETLSIPISSSTFKDKLRYLKYLRGPDERRFKKSE